jgi:hypothetical protein
MIHEDTKKTSKNIKKFYCEVCYFGCSKLGDWTRHKTTPKHKKEEERYKMVKNDTKKHQNTSNYINNYICDCGKEYKHHSGLWRHKKICNKEIKEEPSDKELIMMLIKENSELKNMVLDVCQKIQPLNNTVNSNNINSNNKTFNLNLFLNETCKDAMNIMDFVDSLKLQLSDLESVGKLGFVNGISNIIVKNLNSLDETKRPIHCTDTKREILYVKDDDKWEKENEENNKIRKAIKKVINKNMGLIPQFKEVHPDCSKASSKFSDQYNKIIVESCGGAGDNDFEKEAKIIKNISKVVAIDKKAQ